MENKPSTYYLPMKNTATDNHTPGPWVLWHRDNGAAYVSKMVNGVHGEIKADTLATLHTPECGGDREANARLIASAPDLLEAARMALYALTVHHNAGEHCADVCRLRAAIAKATGTPANGKWPPRRHRLRRVGARPDRARPARFQ